MHWKHAMLQGFLVRSLGSSSKTRGSGHQEMFSRESSVVIDHSGEVGCWHRRLSPIELARTSMHFPSWATNPQDEHLSKFESQNLGSREAATRLHAGVAMTHRYETKRAHKRTLLHFPTFVGRKTVIHNLVGPLLSPHTRNFCACRPVSCSYVAP